MKKKKARMLAAAMLAGGALLNYGTASAADSDRDSAARAIAHSEMDVRSAAEKNATTMDTRNMNVRVSGITVTGGNENTVRALLPELSRDTVNIRTLSQQIQSVNDTGGLLLSTEFTPAGAGAYAHSVARSNLHHHLYGGWGGGAPRCTRL